MTCSCETPCPDALLCPQRRPARPCFPVGPSVALLLSLLATACAPPVVEVSGYEPDMGPLVFSCPSGGCQEVRA